MHYIVTTQPGLQCEHRQNCQRGEAQFRIAQSHPRQHPQSHEGGQRNVETIHSSLWCTGKDSNLRTSEEGQIYSLLALTTHPPVQNCRTVRPFRPTSPPTITARHPAFIRRYLRQRTKIVQTDFAKLRIFANVKNRNAREDAVARKHHTWKIPLWSAVGKSVKPPRRVFCVRNQCWSWRRDLNP